VTCLVICVLQLEYKNIKSLRKGTFLLTQIGSVGTVGPPARHVGAVLLEVSTHQSVESLVARGVLDEPRLVAEAVPAILPLAVEVRLVLSVAAVLVLAVLVEPGQLA
jgi:hypothetical protein